MAGRGGLSPYPGREGKYLADMPLLARRLLARDGVTRVHGGERCTFTERDRFYSYRRDGRRKRAPGEFDLEFELD
jgi:copper oxidase (laccase) domain-containing protein